MLQHDDAKNLSTANGVTDSFKNQLNEPLEQFIVDELFNTDYANEGIYKDDEFIV